MPSTAKQLTPAELSALEHAFAADPASDAYRPLTEAYLAMGRFMEAMVVCKKGVKAHPDDSRRPRPARPCLRGAGQGPQGARGALRGARGVSDVRGGAQDGGRAAPARRRARVRRGGAPQRRGGCPGRSARSASSLAKHGLAPAAKPASGPRTGPDAPPVAPRVAPGAGARAPAASPGRGAATAASRGAPLDEDEDVPVPTPAPIPAKQTRDAAYAQELADKYATQEFTLSTREAAPEGQAGHARDHGRALRRARGRARRMGALQPRAQGADRGDRPASQGHAAAPREGRATPRTWRRRRSSSRSSSSTGSSIAGHAFLAYVDAIRAGEHGEGALAAEAVKHVDAARQLGQRHSHLVAAEAYLKLYGGDAAGAKQAVAAVLEGGDGAQSPLLQGVLGAIHLREGDLDAARDVLGAAQKATPCDVRIAYLLAEEFRRRGEGYELQAVEFYDYALRIQKDHLWSILGKAHVLVERGQLDEAGKAAQLVLAAGPAASKPQQALAHAVRGAVLGAQGKAAEAVAAEAEAAKLDPAAPEIPRLVGLRKLREGDPAGAVEALTRAVSQDPRRLSLYADLVRAQLARDGGAQQAIDTLKRAVARLGDASPRIALLLGDAYRAAGDADLARGQYEKAIQLGKPFPDARVALARLHRARNNVPGALVELTQAIDEYGQGGAGGAAAALRRDGRRGAGARREARDPRGPVRAGARARPRELRGALGRRQARGGRGQALGHRAAAPRRLREALPARRKRAGGGAARRAALTGGGAHCARCFASAASRARTSRSIASIGFPRHPPRLPVRAARVRHPHGDLGARALHLDDRGRAPGSHGPELAARVAPADRLVRAARCRPRARARAPRSRRTPAPRARTGAGSSSIFSTTSAGRAVDPRDDTHRDGQLRDERPRWRSGRRRSPARRP